MFVFLSKQPHRVVIPEQAQIRGRGRHSIAFFCHPDNTTEILPVELPCACSTETDCDKKKSKQPFKTAKNK